MEQTEFIMPTPGSLFREKRRKLGWGLTDVADELLLSVAQVEAIEQDDFDSLPEAPYIIGYWRSYGNLLGIDVTKEIELYKKSRHPPLSNIVLKPNHRSVHHLQEKLRKKSAVVFSVLSVLFLGVIWYWQTPENIQITQRLDENPDPQLVVIDSTDSTEQEVIEDNSQLDTQDLSLIVLPEHSVSEESEAGDEQKIDPSALNLPEEPAPGVQHFPDNSEPVLMDHVENTDQGSVNRESVPSSADLAGESADLNLLSSIQDESQDPIVNAEVMASGTEEAETVVQESDNTDPEVVAAIPEATEESPPSADTAGETAEASETFETAETGEEDGSRPGEVAALPEAEEESPSSAGPVGETSETGEPETSLESGLGTVIDPTSKDQVVIHVEKPMWLDVRERDGTKLLFQNVGPGEPLIINGRAPFWVYLGEADSASVVYLGESVRFEANEGEPFVQIVVGEFPGRNTTEPAAETNE